MLYLEISHPERGSELQIKYTYCEKLIAVQVYFHVIHFVREREPLSSTTLQHFSQFFSPAKDCRAILQAEECKTSVPETARTVSICCIGHDGRSLPQRRYVA